MEIKLTTWGARLLAAFLIVYAILGATNFQFAGSQFILPLLAFLSGVCLLFGW